jgi:PST family polysaccharide transporter
MDNILTALINIFFFYILRPVWKPRFIWSTPVFKYFVNFGARQVVGTWLFDALQRIDKLWIMSALGDTPLGFYSKAYSFAKFPNEFLGTSMDEVAVGTYAELKYDRSGISHAFNRANSVIIRAGFYIVGIMALVAPEFISIALGVKWMPMLMTFRLLLPFTMFDPIKNTLSSIFIAVGKPEIIVKVRVMQLVVLAVGLYALGTLFNIEGAAMAIDLMVITGTFYMLHLARKYADFSLKKLFASPLVGLTLGLAGGYLSTRLFPAQQADILTAIVKSTAYTGIYGAFMILFDRQELLAILKTIRKNF